ncbi:hypothetical protein D3C76_637010 [compost metagenome]|jgi:hypothetical protein
MAINALMHRAFLRLFFCFRTRVSRIGTNAVLPLPKLTLGSRHFVSAGSVNCEAEAEPFQPQPR